jgi:hypothetical protein
MDTAHPPSGQNQQEEEAVMAVTLPGGRLRGALAVLGLCLLTFSVPGPGLKADAGKTTGTLEKLIVAGGRVTLELDMQRLGQTGAGAARTTRPTAVDFDLERDSFLTILVFNGELRGPSPGSARLIPVDVATLPPGLASRDLVVEQTSWGAPYDLVVRDESTGRAVFNVEGHEYTYEPKDRTLGIRGGRLLLSQEFAAQLGRRSAAGSVVGRISVDATMRLIEVTHLVDGEIQSDVLPARNDLGGVPGPDVIVGDVVGLAQFGASGTQVGLAVGTESCNAGAENLNWFALPNNDHPVIPQNLYRMSGGATNDERFEQVGQSSVKHAFTALTLNLCGFGCNGVGGSQLGSGCSDPYSASLNAGPSLGSRAWINPFTGFYPRGDSPTPPNNHNGHVHTGPSHRILTEMADLNTSQNPGATYYAEGQYVTPHEYAWCQAHPGECNMNNNVSYRRYSVTGTTSFSFSPVGATVRTQPAIKAWTGATLSQVQPAPTSDGIAIVGCKVTNPANGVWHYEYAIYNQNLDRAIQSFSVPKQAGVVLSNVGFHAPPQHPAWSADGTAGDAGYSSAPWVQTEGGGQVTWSSETMAQNPNANAIRWGTMYNIRFDANRPPVNALGTLGFFKTGTSAPVMLQVPMSIDPTCSRNGPC